VKIESAVVRYREPPRFSLVRKGMATWAVAMLACAAYHVAVAQTPPPDSDISTLAARIDAHIGDARFAAAAWGIKVVSLDTGKTLYAHDADKLFVPASTAKLYTAALALDTFGPDHRVATTLFATGKPGRDGELRGDLVLVGYGDPTLGLAKDVSWADTLAIELRKTGTMSVRGELIADATWFAAPLYGSGWEAADLQSWFGVPASALSVDENLVKLEIQPAAKVGAKASLRFDPPASAPTVVNTLSTVRAPARTDISLYRAPGDASLYAFGSITSNAGSQTFRLALSDPALIAAEQLRDALVRHGIRVHGKSHSVYWPERDEAMGSDKLQRIADIWSPPVSEIVRRGLKISQNLYLQNLLLMVGAKAAADERAAGIDAPAFRSSETRGIDALHRYLERIGIQASSVLIEDGPGLSRRNLTTPAALTALLVHLGDAPEAAAFRLGLPEAGVDGSLIGRMRDTSAHGRVYAKTGSMNFTHALAGYVTTNAGERLAFTLMLNNYQAPAGASRSMRPSADLDAIAIMLAGLATRSGP
jgi:D-alanyl-D-alanine carboxypeptidase/D-alanyl-D-alanine-endopeptidase (penicillin-binding protein 4)